MNNFLFLGGDKRMISAAKRLSENYDCFIYGFDRHCFSDNGGSPHGESIETCEPEITVLREITKCKSLVLPLPASSDGVHINAPFFKEPLPVKLIPEAVYTGGVVYCGKTCPAIQAVCEENNLKTVDYFEREELIVMNALVTAEGALEIIMNKLPMTIFGTEILITGFGRIAKILARLLIAMGAKVTVTARKYADLAWAEAAGCKTVHISWLTDTLPKYDVAVNTVPAAIFDSSRIKKFKTGCLIVDLASKPAISDNDTELATQKGLHVIRALSLPGKTAPVTAGTVIADTIMNILAENAEISENQKNIKITKNTGGLENA
ncbi:MAG: hypothetical protein FWG44_00490 [Oscillospiraceae bacterium]|nr:hypothetical protein [Oscillospiraceae bacterium]